jgi:ABC-type transport system substrate-binding protein
VVVGLELAGLNRVTARVLGPIRAWILRANSYHASPLALRLGGSDSGAATIQLDGRFTKKHRVFSVNRLSVAAALLVCTGTAFAAKTLVYCSEGSPEGFNPQYYTTGTTFDAASVPMYNRMADPTHPYAKTTQGTTYAYFDDMDMKNIVERVEKVEAPFMANMAMDFASIWSAGYAEKMKAAGTVEVIDKEPVGTGPFSFVSYQ